MARRLLTSLLLVFTGAAMMTVVTPIRPAAAETKIVATVPSDHGVVSSPIDHITLTFDEKIDGANGVVAVTGPGGGRMEAGAPKVSGYDMVQRVRLSELRGDVTVGYRLNMPDGQVVTGSFAYQVASAGPQGPPTDPPSVIASALAQVNGAQRGDESQVTTTRAADENLTDVWWKRPWAVALGAVVLLLLAGVAVLSPARSTRD